jgi:hypothetical protein
MYSTEAEQCKRKEKRNNHLIMIMDVGHIKEMKAEVKLHKQNFYYPYWNLSTRYQVQNCVILANN